jgi:agmatinase
MGLFHHHRKPPEPLKSRDQLSAMQNVRATAAIGDKEKKREVERQLDLGLESAPSINDRTISLFVRGH